jgi:hypothetical protein
MADKASGTEIEILNITQPPHGGFRQFYDVDGNLVSIPPGKAMKFKANDQTLKKIEAMADAPGSGIRIGGERKGKAERDKEKAENTERMSLPKK